MTNFRFDYLFTSCSQLSDNKGLLTPYMEFLKDGSAYVIELHGKYVYQTVIRLKDTHLKWHKKYDQIYPAN